jgi:hypothetical protein
MKNEGRKLEELLNADDQENGVEEIMAADVHGTASLNADIPASTMRDLRMISAYTDTTIKDIVASQLTRFVKRAKKKMMEEMTKGTK